MGTASRLTVRTDLRNGAALLALSGELDMATVPVLEEHLGLAEQDGVGSIMIDLRGVDFVDSSGLSAFRQAQDRAASNGHRLILIGASPSARKLLALTKAQFLLDEQEA